MNRLSPLSAAANLAVGGGEWLVYHLLSVGHPVGAAICRPFPGPTLLSADHSPGPSTPLKNRAGQSPPLTYSLSIIHCPLFPHPQPERPILQDVGAQGVPVLSQERIPLWVRRDKALFRVRRPQRGLGARRQEVPPVPPLRVPVVEGPAGVAVVIELPGLPLAAAPMQKEICQPSWPRMSGTRSATSRPCPT